MKQPIFYASLGYTDMEGVAKDASYSRLNATLKGTWKMSDKVVVQMSNMLARAVQKGPLIMVIFKTLFWEQNLSMVLNQSTMRMEVITLI